MYAQVFQEIETLSKMQTRLANTVGTRYVAALIDDIIAKAATQQWL